MSMTVDFRIFLDAAKRDVPVLLEKVLAALLKKGVRFNERFLPLRYPSLKDLPPLREMSHLMTPEDLLTQFSPSLIYKELSFVFTYSFFREGHCIFIFCDQSTMRPTQEHNRERAKNFIEIARVVWESLPLNVKIFGIADLEYTLENFENEVQDAKKIREPLGYWLTFYGEALSKEIGLEKFKCQNWHRIEKVKGGLMMVTKELPQHIVG